MKGDWPTGIEWASDPGDVPELADKMATAHADAWLRHESLRQLYERYFPDEWSALQRCRRDVKEAKNKNKQGASWMVQLDSCRRRPYCPACNDAWRNMRATRARKAFETTTPMKEDVIAIGWTFAAREHTKGHEWHRRAKQDHRALMRGVAKAIDQCYGGGTGQFSTFQPYGEKLLVEDHPHTHHIVNGWATRDDKPHRLGRVHIPRNGIETFTEPFRTHVGRELKCEVPFGSYNVHVTRVATGRYSIEGSFRYNFRELIDPKKFEYDPERDLVEVSNYNDPYDKARIPAMTLRPRILAYAIKYGDYTDLGKIGPHRGTRPVDAWHGTMSGRKINETASIMGGGARHPDTCKCHDCAEWERPQYRPDLRRPALLQDMRPF